MSMDYVYTQGDILVEPYKFEKILNLKLIREVNDHAKLYIKGVILDELIDTYVEQAGASSSIKISLKDNEGNITEIFNGGVVDISINSFNNVKTLEVSAMSNTYLMDIEKKSRSFQGDNLTYRQIFNTINSAYGNVQMIDYVSAGRTIDKIVVQYNETDWEFLKRLVSHFNVPVIPECILGGVKYSIGKGGASASCALNEFNYSIKKGLREYSIKSSSYGNSVPLNDLNFITYEVRTNRILKLFSSVSFKEKNLIVYKCEMELINGILSNKYYLRDEYGTMVRKRFNEAISGASLYGKIVDVTKDIVKVALEIDGYSNTAQKNTIWIHYSTVFSSPDGTGWYCMPEIGDAIRLYFPENIESSCYVINAVDLKSSNSQARQDPAVKSLSTKYGKQIIMRPGAIDVISSANTMTLNDNNGITVNSNKSISMSAPSIGISGGYVSISGGSGVTLAQNGASILIKNDITMSGFKINTQ